VSTVDYLRGQGDRIAGQIEEEANHLFHKWAHFDSTADDIRELSTVAVYLGARLYKIAGDALTMAEQLAPTYPDTYEPPDHVFQRRLTVVDGCQGDS